MNYKTNKKREVKIKADEGMKQHQIINVSTQNPKKYTLKTNFLNKSYLKYNK